MSFATRITMARSGRQRLLLGALASFAMGLSVSPNPAFAQEPDEEAIEEVVVTGTRLVRGNAVAVSPITSVGASDIEARGTIRMEDLLNTLPQVSPAETASKANEATGTATVDLRGLGAERTLVLVNGKRLPFGSPIAAAADVNQVPSQLVERVDVLTGGASAVYGADAVAGVVNFILKDDFEGVQLDFQAGAFQTGNSASQIRSVLNEFGQPVPGSAFDGESYNFNLMVGANTGDGRGNVTGYFTYRKQQAVLQGERIGSACAFGSRNGGNEFTCAGSGTTFPAQFANSAPVAVPFQVTLDDQSGAPRPFVFPDDTYNFAPVNNYIQPNDRYAFGLNGHYELSDRVEFYAEYGFTDNTIVDQIAPSGIFFGQTDTINCDNPFLSAELVEIICTNNGFSGAENAPVNIGRRNVEGGGRRNEIGHTSYRAVVGLRGDINDVWSYDVSGQYADVQYTDEADNFFNINQVLKALEVRNDPTTGEPVCQSVIDGSDPACVPYNVFELGGVTQEALDYIQAPGFRAGNVTQTVLSGSFNGDLGQYGVQLPTADDGVQLVVGFEYREETLRQTNDFLVRSGALGNPRADVEGDIAVRELFTEFQVPLVQGRRGIEDLSVNAAYRYSDFYRTTGDQSTYAAGLSYSPVEEFRFRAQVQRATRSPNPIELFAPQNRFEFNLPELPNGAFDPCGGPTPFRTLEECERTGVTAAQYGQIISLGGQFNNLTGGNADLDVETSDTVTVGIVVAPRFIEGLQFSIDYFDISVDDFIGTVPEQISLNNCLDTGDPFFCSLIVRDPVNGRLSGNENAFVIATNVNTGSLETSGFDVVATYDFEIDGWGSVTVDYAATYLDTLEKVPLPGEPAFECAGFFSPQRAQCGVSSPTYRHRLPITWQSTWNNDFSAQLAWRHFGGVDQFGTNGDTLISSLGSRNYIDLSLRATMLDYVDVRFGVNNLFDKQPPVSNQVGGAGGSFGTGNTFPGVYDALGRFLFLGGTITF